MSEYRDIHNNVYTIIQRSIDFVNEDDKQASKEQILVSVCSACHNVLKQTNHAMQTNQAFADKVNRYMAEDGSYNPSAACPPAYGPRCNNSGSRRRRSSAYR